ncbi:hypothetical protein ABT336_19725 [Micromonospora sp. NPDC000207]|uniref:hypothetical protein n=1 Tax=Micromonospora sp. NPDC000207 TaxID=3154246 RepID=UPI00331A781C
MNPLPVRRALGTLLLAGLLAAILAAPAHATPGRPGTPPAADLGWAGPGAPPVGSDGRVGAARTDVLGVAGAGPYRFGARLDQLTAAGLVDWTAPVCGTVVDAGATGEWAGVILLTFQDGRLVGIGTATAPPRSPAGAAVGMSFADLEAIYGPRGASIDDDAGTATAYLVRLGSRVELFTGHPIRPGVGYFQVGPASFVERAFRQGRVC